MTQELTFTLYLLIAAFALIILLAFWAWSLWREIADLEARATYAEQAHYGTTMDLTAIEQNIRNLEKRIVVLEDGVKDLSGHADLVAQWINLATEKFEDKK